MSASQQNDQEFTPLSDVGELGLIERIRERIGPPKGEQVRQAIGDDAAVYSVSDQDLHVLTSDMLVEGVHFDRRFMPMRHLGFKAISANVSDVAAMNGQPLYATVSLGVPNNFSVEMVDQIYDGIAEAADVYSFDIVGGDVAAARRLVVSVTVVGETGEDRVTYRGGAQVGDLIVVTGSLGAAYAGLKVLLEEQERFEEEDEDYTPNLDPHTYVIERHLRPPARVDALEVLRDKDIRPHAMIDVSDGLASEVNHLARASECGAMVREVALPIQMETREVADLFEDDVSEYALYGGEDYELVLALSDDQFEAVPDRLFSAVGEFQPRQKGITFKTTAREVVDLTSEGYRHF